MKKIILVLGAPNDKFGNLSQIAIDRLDCTFGISRNNNDSQILCSGGHGDFNPTDRPHAEYSKAYLMTKGVPLQDFLPFALSAHSVDDIRKSLPILEFEQADLIMLVTSDFHMPRIKILWEIMAPKNLPIVFIPATSRLDARELTNLQQHEKLAIQTLEKNHYKVY